MSVYNTSYLFSERPEIKKEFLAAIKKYQTIVGSTIGGKGKQVLFHTDLDMIRTTNDGITVIRGLYPEDPIEQAALALMKQVSEKTNMKNGDFSSGSAWLFAEFLLRGIEFDKNSDGVIEEIVEKIKTNATMVKTEKELIDLATVSCKNEKLGKLIGSMSHELGYKNNGSTVIKYATENKHSHKVIEGLATIGVFADQKFYKQLKETSKDVRIILIDDEINSFLQIKPLYEMLTRDEEKSGFFPHIIIGRNFTDEVVSTALRLFDQGMDIRLLRLNSAAGMLKDTMTNLEIITGATRLGESTAYPLTRDPRYNPLGDATKKHIGVIKEFTINGINGEVIFAPHKTTSMVEKIIDRVVELESIIKQPETQPEDKKRYEMLISQISGKIANLYIAGDTPAEQEHNGLTAEDAVNTCKSAKELGYIAGGGVELRDIANDLTKNKQHIGIASVLKSLYIKILENSNIENDETKEKEGFGYNGVTGEYGDMVDLGIIDAAKGIIYGLKSAYSLAKQVNNASTLVIQKPQNKVK